MVIPKFMKKTLTMITLMAITFFLTASPNQFNLNYNLQAHTSKSFAQTKKLKTANFLDNQVNKTYLIGDKIKDITPYLTSFVDYAIGIYDTFEPVYALYDKFRVYNIWENKEENFRLKSEIKRNEVKLSLEFDLK